MRATSVILPILASLTALVSGAAINGEGNTLDKRATGTLKYTYKHYDGTTREGELENPPSEKCINIDEVGNGPAVSPINHTKDAAILFLDANCGGTTDYILNAGKKLGPKFQFRSVLFVF